MVKRLGLKLRQWWRLRPWPLKIYDMFLYGFALTGVAIIGAWAVFQLGLTNNGGKVDRNNRYLQAVGAIDSDSTHIATDQQLMDKWGEQYARLIALSKYYPLNARLIMEAAKTSNDPLIVDKMLAASEMYMGEQEGYKQMTNSLLNQVKRYGHHDNGHAIPWMNTEEWQLLKHSIAADKALICEAGRLTGVEPRMIVACLVGEQIRLYNTSREKVKQYLGPMKVLSVQSQFSWGVNGIKNHTAEAVETHLKDSTSEFYMGKDYENLLDFETTDYVNERYNRLVDYRNHLYSYIYTGCILHQTMLQWKRAGYDITHRPDILFTLFNVGFAQSHPHAQPRCGGSTIKIDGEDYTFGAIGFDFYYSGELSSEFPFHKQRFITKRDRQFSDEEIADIQDNVSDCRRPERGEEYASDSHTTPDANGQSHTPAIGQPQPYSPMMHDAGSTSLPSSFAEPPAMKE